jgi:8-oxo-dGTP pyrophosphatase MutT (NUDIX family)
LKGRKFLVKQLVKLDREIPWLPRPSEARLYAADELPPPEICRAVACFAFQGELMLFCRRTGGNWDLPGGLIAPGEAPAAAAVRCAWESALVRVEQVELVGLHEFEILGPRRAAGPWGAPLNATLYYLCRVSEIAPLQLSAEGIDRAFFPPGVALTLPMMRNYDRLFDVIQGKIKAK